MKINHLDYYYSCMETGVLKGKITRWGSSNTNGLCNEDIDQRLLALFEPTEEDVREYKLGDRDSNTGINGWWGAGLSESADNYTLESVFSPLRQTIVLFIAAMKGQL